MGIIIDTEYKRYLIDENEFDKTISDCEKHRWENIREKIGIFPFHEENLGPFSYDLCIGNEACILRTGQKLKLKRGEFIDIEPSSTVIILTLEYIVLSKIFGGIIQPKARHLIVGIDQSSAKIDPTWYGNLGIAITNKCNEIISFKWGDPFCTMITFKLENEVQKILTKKDVPFIGQRTLEITPPSAKPWKEKKPETITNEDMERVVELYGPPFDIIRGMFKVKSDEILRYIDEDWGKTSLKEMKHILWEDEIKYIRSSSNRNFIAMLLAIIGWIGIAITLIITLLK